MFAVRHLRFLLILSCFFFWGCSHLLYYPMKGNRYTPEQVQLTFEDVIFKDSLGNNLNGWWFPAKTKVVKGTFVFFHGNAENISTHFLSLKWLPEQGYNYFIFDYPGYGKSKGVPTPESTVMAGHAALKWVNQNKYSEPLIIYGNSLGGIVALRTVLDLKKEIPILAFIADDTFSSYHRVARIKLSTHWLTWIFQPLAYVVLSDKWAPKKIADISPIPILVIHGDSDRTVETANGKKLFQEAAEPKEFWLKTKGVHGDTFWGYDFIYRTKVLEWLARVSRTTK
ncbi:MAG: alpha/beta hydrolase [Pseudobdellovibrionaceae bacterium]|jgi:fermentation-respiration switch protein FrsA (DUF1100 family)